MRVLVDTSVIVEIDRQKQETVSLLKRLAAKSELLVSTVTVSEILTGSYLRRDVTASVVTAKEILNQFRWIDLDGAVAEKTGQLLAYLLTEKKSVGYQDVVIAASALIANADYLLTQNKKDFLIFPPLRGKVFSPEELGRELRG